MPWSRHGGRVVHGALAVLRLKSFDQCKRNTRYSIDACIESIEGILNFPTLFYHIQWKSLAANQFWQKFYGGIWHAQIDVLKPHPFLAGRLERIHPEHHATDACPSTGTWTWRRKWRKHVTCEIITWCGPVASSHLPAISTNYQRVGILTQSPTQNIIWMFYPPCQGCKVTSVSVRGTQAFDKFLKYLEILHYGTMDLRWGLKIVKMTLPVSNFGLQIIQPLGVGWKSCENVS